jgi:uncharacterized Zn finger protein
MKKLTVEQCKELSALKGLDGGRYKFFDLVENIYKDEPKILAEAEKLRNMLESVDEIEFWGAWQKSQNMYYSYMDDFLNKIGYHYIEA